MDLDRLAAIHVKLSMLKRVRLKLQENRGFLWASRHESIQYLLKLHAKTVLQSFQAKCVKIMPKFQALLNNA
jgi:hypothetical protein